MIKVKAKVTTSDGKVLFLGKEGNYYSDVFEGEKALRSYLYEKLYWNNGQKVPHPVEGEKGKLTVTFEWECTMNRRAPARAKSVIAAEKAQRAAKHAAKAACQAEWEKERQQNVLNVRNRIRHQIDHAFITGKSGTEPVSKYITCEHCNAAAAYLTLSQPLPKGAHVLDEDMIIGARCAKHVGNSHWDKTEKIPCTRLEFFYDGVRTIGVKP